MNTTKTEEKTIKKGDIVNHKLDNREMVVVGFATDGLDIYSEDETKPICRFLKEKTDTYETEAFDVVEFKGY